MLIFLVGLVLATLSFVVNRLDSGVLDEWRTQKTAAALAEAKTALLWYAETFREQQNRIQIEADNSPPNPVYGYLPLPDLGNGTDGNTNIGCPWEGCDANLSGNTLNQTIIGRLPWLVLGTGPLRDGHGECLWYAVSGSYQRVDKTSPMNWDTLGQIDVVTTSETDPAKLRILLAGPHERPTAIVFSPGPLIGNQDRGGNGDHDVRICGGNYAPANYLDPGLATILGTGSTYFSGSRSTDTAPGHDRLAIETQGRLYRGSTDNAIRSACKPAESDCRLIANDVGLPLGADGLFGTIRKNAYFRQDINSLLDRMVGCLRDQFFGAGTLPAYGKIDSDDYLDYSSCYNDAVVPQNYFAHYKELIFVAPGSGVVANGLNCNGALLFSSQRGSGQLRETPTDKNNWANYLEDINLVSFGSAGTSFSGPDIFERVSASQPRERDIARCIPNTPSLVTVGPAIPGLGQLATYSPAARTLTLGLPVSTAQPTSMAGSLYGCAWTPETHAMGGGLRSYFMFRINDAGFSSAASEGIGFAIVDGDSNGTDACGGAGQHMGYSGSNAITPSIAPPKIAFEVDPRRESIFNPGASDALLNGRNDPSISGGHVALVYWGGESVIGGLTPEQDDNVHGHPVAPYASGRTGYPLPPVNLPYVAGSNDNPKADCPTGELCGIFKLDPSYSQVPVSRNFHVRVELNRNPSTTAVTTVRVATVGPINIAAPGSAIDGVLLFFNDRILVKDQATAAENGLYIWNTATRPLTRAPDADTGQKLAGSVAEVAQGAVNARTLWYQTTPAPIPGLDPLRWNNLRVKVAATQAAISIASPGAKIDGILMKPGDRVLVLDLGIFVWNGTGTPLTAAADNLSGAMVQVQQGSSATGWWRFVDSQWLRQSVRVATQGNIDLAAPANPVDNVTLASGDSVLVKAQSVASENGLYAWGGAGAPLTRTTGSAGGLTQVLEGSDAGRAFRQTSTTGWAALDGSPQYTLEAWVLPDSATTALQIAAMQDTTRPMSFLAPTFSAHLRDMPKIPYPFRNVRLGFTLGQRRTVTDQNFTVSNAFTTWIP